MSHLVSYKRFRRTQVIPEYVVFYKYEEDCKEGVSYWDDGGNEFDKNLNLISKN